MSARRPLLFPFVPLYAAALRLKGRSLPEPKRLHSPVLSIGSVSAGGAGKTPLTLLLIHLLQQAGFEPIVLSRGYKREGTGIERVQPGGDAQRFGDEPVMLATQSGVPVYVGGDRHGAGLLAEKEASGRTVFLLDDGFQHRRLARDLDIVLLTKRDVADALLPAGDLREPLRALRRADVIVLREEEAAQLEPLLSRWTDPARPPAVWQVRRRLHFPGPVPKRPMAFCGIARPGGFLEMLRAAGCPPADHMLFGDHHTYSERDLHRIIRRAQHHRADACVTTEKDMVRLTPEMLSKLQHFFPVVVARLEVDLLDADAALAGLVERLHASAPHEKIEH